MESSQVIISMNQNPHHDHDIYMSTVNKGLECAAQGRFVTVISTRVKTNDEAAARAALTPALELVSSICMHQWLTFRPTFSANNHEAGDNVFIPSSMDSATHFQNAIREVKNIYQAVTGEELDLTVKPKEEDMGEN